MSGQIDNGGPAFPRGSTLRPDGSIWTVSQEGMSLRDWFAGKALAAMINREDLDDYSPTGLAGDAYRYADAMIAAREGGGQ